MSDSLHRLLGVPPDASAERLKAEYERAVTAATRAGEWRRAAELSAAFDALPRATRVTIYSGRERDADPWRPTEPIAVRPRGSRRARPRKAFRTVVTVGVTAIVTVLIAVAWVSHQRGARTALAPRPVGIHSLPVTQATVVRRPPPASWSPMDALYPGTGEVLIPLDAVVNSDGLAQVLCPDRATGSWQRIAVPPGSRFVCPSGDVGQVLVPPRPSPSR